MRDQKVHSFSFIFVIAQADHLYSPGREEAFRLKSTPCRSDARELNTPSRIVPSARTNGHEASTVGTCGTGKILAYHIILSIQVCRHEVLEARVGASFDTVASKALALTLNRYILYTSPGCLWSQRRDIKSETSGATLRFNLQVFDTGVRREAEIIKGASS